MSWNLFSKVYGQMAIFFNWRGLVQSHHFNSHQSQSRRRWDRRYHRPCRIGQSNIFVVFFQLIYSIGNFPLCDVELLIECNAWRVEAFERHLSDGRKSGLRFSRALDLPWNGQGEHSLRTCRGHRSLQKSHRSVLLAGWLDSVTTRRRHASWRERHHA